VRRAAFVVIATLFALLGANVSAPPALVEKLRPTATPTPTPKVAQRRVMWPIAYPRMLKRGAIWSPLWVLPPLAPRPGK
jgi:hypothetical protein